MKWTEHRKEECDLRFAVSDLQFTFEKVIDLKWIESLPSFNALAMDAHFRQWLFRRGYVFGVCPRLRVVVLGVCRYYNDNNNNNHDDE